MENTHVPRKMFERWIMVSKVETYEQSKEIILLEQLFRGIAKAIRLRFVEREMDNVNRAVAMADNYDQTHRKR